MYLVSFNPQNKTASSVIIIIFILQWRKWKVTEHKTFFFIKTEIFEILVSNSITKQTIESPSLKKANPQKHWLKYMYIKIAPVTFNFISKWKYFNSYFFRDF